ncbi:MAG TPA: glycosyltransferase [Vicinamibacteria bacterium]
MKVLMVTSSYPLCPGDVVAPFIEEIARGVAGAGHRVDVLLPHHPRLRRPPGEPVRFFPYRYAPFASWNVWGYAQSLEADVRVRGGAFLLAPFVAGALREALSTRLLAERYDVVHAHWLVPNAAMVADLVRAHHVPLVVSLHGSDVFLAERLLPARVLARRVLRGAGVVTACSGDLRDRALLLGADAKRTRLVPYGVDLAAFAPEGDPAAAAATRARLGVKDGDLFVLGLGRLVEKKGFADLVAATARCEGVHAVIAGQGDLRSALEAQARATGARVTFAGALDRAAASAALAAADVVAVPSVRDRAGNVDGLPNVLLEALATGRPVVASRVAGIPEVVGDDENGLLVPEHDPGAIAAALLRLRREPETRARLGLAARRRAEATLSWGAAVRAFEEAYAEAAALDAR